MFSKNRNNTSKMQTLQLYERERKKRAKTLF